MKRALYSLPPAAMVTFGLLVFMANLVKSPVSPKVVPDNPIIDINFSFEETNATNIPRETPLPPKPEVKQIPPQTTFSQNQDTESAQPPVLKGLPDMTGLGTEFGGPQVVLGPAEPQGPGGDAQATPMVRSEPAYPIDALRDGKEGWVKLAFEINAMGQVENVTVLDAKPKGVFERAAKRALKRWRYRPMVEGGNAVRQTGQSVVLEFSLNKK